MMAKKKSEQRRLSCYGDHRGIEHCVLGGCGDQAPVEMAGRSLRDLRVAEVSKLDMKVEDGKVVAYRARFPVIQIRSVTAGPRRRRCCRRRGSATR